MPWNQGLQRLKGGCKGTVVPSRARRGLPREEVGVLAEVAVESTEKNKSPGGGEGSRGRVPRDMCLGKGTTSPGPR